MFKKVAETSFGIIVSKLFVVVVMNHVKTCSEEDKENEEQVNHEKDNNSSDSNSLESEITIWDPSNNI